MGAKEEEDFETDVPSINRSIKQYEDDEDELQIKAKALLELGWKVTASRRKGGKHWAGF